MNLRSKTHPVGLAVTALALSCSVAIAASPWQRTPALPTERALAGASVRADLPDSYATFMLDDASMKALLAAAPVEDGPDALNPALVELPMPDGSLARYHVLESSVMAPELAARFPEIRSYIAQGVDDPASVARFVTGPGGFRGMIRSEGGSVFINPALDRASPHYIAFNIKDAEIRSFVCGVAPALDQAARAFPDDQPFEPQGVVNRAGPTRKTFDFALACTGEFSQSYGNSTVQGTLDAMNVLVSRINLVYENEVAARFILVADNTDVIFTNPNTDPFVGQTDAQLLNEIQGVLNANITTFDVGHLLNAGSGSGIAQLGVICGSARGRGVSSVGGAIDSVGAVGLVVHEMGHQFNAPHSFNAANGSCSTNIDFSGSYEPGSGSTPMSYAGICGLDNIASNPDLYFHSGSFDRIISLINCCTSCATSTATGNTAPTVNAGPDRVIPANTPFILTATGSDPNGHALTFCWEQRDLGNQGALTDLDDGVDPLMRSFPPVSDPTRVVPNLNTLLNNVNVVGERLYGVSRFSTWRVTARDNVAGNGGVNTDDMVIQVVNTGAGFRVTSPNSPGQFAQNIDVTWNVAGTTAAPISTANVRIELSADGGFTWPHVLIASTPNDGSQNVPLPAINTAQGRIRVIATNSIFFDISDTNITVTPLPAPTPFSLTSPPNTSVNISLTPTLQWQGSLNTDSYTITIDTDVNLTPPSVYTASVVGTSHPVPPGTLAGSTLYYWRVEAVNSFSSLAGTPNPSSFITAAPPPFCQGNANGDGIVNFADITSVLSNLGTTYFPGARGPGDANNDGAVNFADITAVLAGLGNLCP